MTSRAPLGQVEFVALMAMLAATIAFSIDAMLPALPAMGRELSPLEPDRVSLVVSSFLIGMGLGTFFAGPMSDAWGRKPIMLAGAALYVIGASAALAAQDLEMMLAARCLQGFGGAGPRIVAIAVIRDLYKGRDMARLVSFVMVVFTLVPVFAPSLGAGVTAMYGWRGIFVAFIVFSLISALWLMVRLQESLAPRDRRPFQAAMIGAGLKEIASIRVVRLSILAQTLGFGILFGILSNTQLIFDHTFGEGARFHLWFGAIALVAGGSGFLNAMLVTRVGMRAITSRMFLVAGVASVIMVCSWIFDLHHDTRFWVFILWQTTLFFMAGMTIGNLNAIAMEPLGHIAGLAASSMGALATIGGAAIAAATTLLFDGTPKPLAISICALSWICFLVSRKTSRAPDIVTAN